MLKYLRKQLASQLEARDALEAAVAAAIAPAEKEERNLTEAEASKLSEARAALSAHDQGIEDLVKQVEEAEEDEKRSAKVAEARKSLGMDVRKSDDQGDHYSPAVVTWEAGTYEQFGQRSYFKDLVAVSLNRGDSDEARERLTRSVKETQTDARDLVKKEGRSAPMEIRALTTTDGAGGEFVPPLWMLQDYIQLARAARPTADRVRNMSLPGGTDSINLPRIATGTAVAEQASQNTAVQNTDATTNSVSASVTTLAGQQVIAVQLIEQSPINMDDILLQDLALDYAAKVDLFVLNNNAAGKYGLLQQAGTLGVTRTGATTIAQFYGSIADLTQQIFTNRYLPPDTIVMHPRRWASFMAAVDSSNRPLIVPTAGQNAFNALGTTNGLVPQGVAGNIGGIDVVVDPNVPTNLGAGTNEDRIIVLRAADSILWEGAPNAEAFRETKADQLSVLLRFYRYCAFTAGRYAKSVGVISGTGLVPPTF